MVKCKPLGVGAGIGGGFGWDQRSVFRDGFRKRFLAPK